MTQKTVVRVTDVMDADVIMIDGVATVADAIRSMQDHDVHFLFVAKREEDDEFGIVLVADIAKQVLARDRAPERINVYEIMSKPVLSVPPRMDIRYCARLFHRFGIAAAPVVDDGEIQGAVTYGRLVLRGLADAL